MTRLILLMMGLLFLFGCGESPSKDQGSGEDLSAFKERFLKNFWNQYPGWASYEGLHQYDSVLSVPDKARREAELDFCKRYLDSIGTIQEEGLDAADLTDLWMMRDRLEATIWYIEEFKEHEWNPARYNVGSGFARILNGNHAPLESRLRMLAAKMNGVEEYYLAAQQTVNRPTAEHTELAIFQNRGALDVFGPAMLDSVQLSGLSDTEKEDLLAEIELAKMAITDYIGFLENEIVPVLESDARSFRIGKELYMQKFKHDIASASDAHQIYKKALSSKKESHRQMFELTEQLWAKYLSDTPRPKDSLLAIKQMVDHLSRKHAHRDSFLQAIEAQIPQLTEFVNEHHIITLDPDEPLVVRKEPSYMAGVAGASISAPGPFEKNGETYYNVGTLEHYSDEQAESYLREYNDYILQILNIHEAIPGHYAQLVYANRSPSLIKSVFGNGAMIEGWAVYAERMMLEQGYGNNEPEMWLMYHKWHLRTVCNTILDYAVHVKNMTEEEAMDLLVNEAFQQEAEAQGKWRRVRLSQVQLCSYYAGYSELMELRNELKQMQGEDFDLKQFHEDLLAHGSAPIRYVRQLMMEKWNDQKES